MRAIVLLSGGLDSYTAAAIARSEGFTLNALTVQYGQRHQRELESARRVARRLDVERHLELAVDLRAIGASALTSDDPVPRDRDLVSPGIPATYVPARNTILLSLALGWAEALEAQDLFIGVNALDYSGYPD
jgi:7-cyano-7-deazaguanine synthase